ncbi:protein FAR1-RELATED SEQUENCE 5 [Brachypodium distachyon]|uniref:protein FAR1-RELATED SEQUENCE 5 n=1 Tax=Brachypodium distachyon TaxID=15368 RepID=UPI00052FFFAF|nr:protein FAR1-RELATED SEQUENCE 5 [Brachypodium distachyon]|eukprot:XP_010236728.1 protein FAR1-RELATED SEQUENCE 5 [Brachypodium distachyon]
MLSEEDIDIFLDNEVITEAVTSSQEVRDSLVPRMGMLFDSDKEAYEFYNTYASVSGSSAKKASCYHSRKRDIGKPTRHTFKCNRCGKVLDKEKQGEKRRDEQIRRAEKKVIQGLQPQKKRKRNLLEVTDCKAQMVISLRSGKWEVITLEVEHNHELSPPDETRFLISHKHMTNEEKQLIRTLNAVKLPTRKIMGILAVYRGGIKAVPYNKKYVSNYMTAIKQESRTNDMMQVSEYFTKRESLDPLFYFAIKLDVNNTVKSLFWADSNARRLYEAYGDCVSFDTTYGTNRYNLPFSPFVGITGHGSNCLFGCSILENETIETFKWLFETFLHRMHGKHPVSIITDQDVAMKQAIPLVFKNVTHRNCLWHIKKKAEERCAKAFATKRNLHEEFNDILNNTLTKEEFEELGPQMIVKYGVEDIKYLQDMWLDRRRFVPVYYKNVFFPFINSTTRSEGTNAIFKDNVCSTYTVISLLGEYQTIAENIEEKEKELDLVTRTTNPSYIHCSEMEIVTGKAYNRAIFYKFQKQLRFTSNLHVDEVQRFEKYEVYKSNYYAAMEFRSRRYVVAVDMKNKDFACLCCKFQKDGILCAHILKVLIHLNIPRIPDKYIIQRWRPRDRKVERDKRYNIPRELTCGNSQLRYNILCRWYTDISSEGAQHNEDYLMLVEEAKRLQEKLHANAAAREGRKGSSDEGSGQGNPNAAEPSAVPVQPKPHIQINDPTVATAKGCAQGTKKQTRKVQKKGGGGKPTGNIETSRNEGSTSVVTVEAAEHILRRMDLEAAKVARAG